MEEAVSYENVLIICEEIDSMIVEDCTNEFFSYVQQYVNDIRKVLK